VRAEPHRACRRLDLPDEDAQQRGLARAVRAEQRDALAVAQRHADVTEQPARLAEAVPDAVQRRDLLPAARHLAEVEPEAPALAWLLDAVIRLEVALQLLLAGQRLLRDLLGVAAHARLARGGGQLHTLGVHLRSVDVGAQAAL